jgi:phage head maturation protease
MRDLVPRGVLEFRAAEVADVVEAKRLVTMVAAPYDEPALVEYRGRMVRESFAPLAFAGVEKRPGRVVVNRDHDHQRLVGRAIEFREGGGLIATAKVAETPVGDESLELARIGALSASVGMYVDLRGQVVTSTTRRITRAWLDHLALVPQPAYPGAVVLSVTD